MYSPSLVATIQLADDFEEAFDDVTAKVWQVMVPLPLLPIHPPPIMQPVELRTTPVAEVVAPMRVPGD